jgi:pyridinium-3,5-bisthiocarboxylic acid mononucleotide nickel chelatase
MWVMETNVDDLDPRVWPTVLTALLEAGATDAWLVPIIMKKGRPARTLRVLARDAERTALRDAVFALTSTIGVRESPVSRVALHRDWRSVALRGGDVRIKVALRAGRIVHATPEFDDAAALAKARGVPVRQVLDEAVAAAEAAMLRPGERWPGERGPGEPLDQDGAAI